MGLLGGSKSLSGSAQKWAQPIAQAAAGNVQSVFNQNQGNLQNLTDTVNSTIPQAAQTYQGWQPATAQSQQYYSDTIGGKYLDPSNNPGLQGLLDQTSRDVTNQVNSQFSMAGRYGSGAQTDVLSRNLADAQNNVLYQNYAQERSNQQAAAAAPMQGQTSGLAALLSAAGTGAELPYVGTNALASGLSSLFSGGTVKQSAGIGGLLSGAGSLASGAAALGASDRRLKTNIRKVSEFFDGLGKYTWNYIWGGPEVVGVMADEVAQLRPWALGPEMAGFATVNYAAL